MRRIFLCLLLIFAFVFSIWVGYYYSSLWKKENMSITEDNTKNNNTIFTETVSNEEKVSFNTNFVLKKYYNECGHVKIVNSELPRELINLTETEVKENYPLWRVEKFSRDELVLAQNIDKMCDEHYMLKLGEENLEIYNLKEVDDYELFKTTGISREYLTNADIEQLEEGIYVYGIGNLNSALEDFE